MAIADQLGAPYYLADFTHLDQVRELAARLRTDYPRIDVLANNAGGVMGKRLKRLILISPEEGGRRLTWLAEGVPGSTWQSGGYYEENEPAPTNPQADDATLAEDLWDRSAAMLGI